MGTRGLMAFAHNGEVKGMYNHFDSYPDYLGKHIQSWMQKQNGDFTDAIEKFDRLVAVDEDAEPTEDQQLALLQYFDPKVSMRTSTEWYSLLRNTQGDPEAALNAGFYIDGLHFAKDSLFCEWGYVVDLDRKVLEVYKGFQLAPHAEGRFTEGLEEPPNPSIRMRPYYAIRKIREFTLEDLAHGDLMDRLELELEAEEEEEN